MALKFTVQYGNLLHDTYTDGRTWKVAVNHAQGTIESKSATATWNAGTKTVTFATNMKFTIPEDTTVTEITLADEGGVGTIAIEEVTGGYYQYGGILEITSLRIEHEYTTA